MSVTPKPPTEKLDFSVFETPGPEIDSVFEAFAQSDPPTTPSSPATPAERAAALAIEVQSREAERSGLLPTRHPNQDFFVAAMVDFSFKSDMAGMEAPIFALSTKPDTKLWSWTSADGKKSVKIKPGLDGRATIFDKDILIYAASQLVAAKNAGLPISKTVRYSVYDFLVSTNRRTDGDEYARHHEALSRLVGTVLATNIKTGRQRITSEFSLVADRKTIDKDTKTGRITSVEITLSDWLFNSILSFEVLTISEDYFKIRQSLERRIYELARKHMGRQAEWAISVDSLFDKSGSTGDIRNFRRYLRNIVERNELPEFALSIGSNDAGETHLFVRRRADLPDKNV